MNFSTRLAIRYLRGKKRGFLQGSNLLSLGGIILSVFSLLVVSTVMNGFDKDIMDRVIGTKAEIKLYTQNYNHMDNYNALLKLLEQDPLVNSTAPVVENELMIMNGKNMLGTMNYGINLEQHKKVTHIFDLIPDNINERKETVLRGMVNGLADQQLLDEDGIILGMDLAMQLQVSVGDTVQIVSPINTIATPLGMLPQSKNLVVIGTFVSGMPEYDRLFSYISLANGQAFSKNPESISYVEIKTYDSHRLQQISQKIQQKYPNYLVEDWSHFDPNLFNAMKMEKIVMISVLSLMLLITSFNMTGNLLKLTVLKRKEIGILKALGSTNVNIRNIFLFQGLFLTICGIFVGVTLALTILEIQAHFHLIKIPMGTFPLLDLPVEIKLQDFIIVPIISILISLFSVFYPSSKIAKLNPIETIRN
jgi:lipoprotein-releasing system permease protein